MNEEIKAFLLQLQSEFKSATDVKIKFNLINNIIQIEAEDKTLNGLLYQHMKLWLKLYVKSVDMKKMEYDKVIFSKVKEKIDLLEIEQQYEIVKYFIRLLKKELYDTEDYENYLKKLEVKMLLKNDSFLKFILRISSYNLITVLITLLLIVLFSSSLWLILQSEECSIINISVNNYTVSTYWNYVFNVLGYIFGIGKKLLVTTPAEFIFLISIKLLFYIFITYFVLKEISKKADKYL